MLPCEEVCPISSSLSRIRYPVFLRRSSSFVNNHPDIFVVGNLHQAELFMMRLARSSGIIGLAGMAFVSHFHSRRPTSTNHTGLLLVRPLLHFSKQDLYAVCPIILTRFAMTWDIISNALRSNMFRASISLCLAVLELVETIFNGSCFPVLSA